MAKGYDCERVDFMGNSVWGIFPRGNREGRIALSESADSARRVAEAMTNDQSFREALQLLGVVPEGFLERIRKLVQLEKDNPQIASEKVGQALGEFFGRGRRVDGA